MSAGESAPLVEQTSSAFNHRTPVYSLAIPLLGRRLGLFRCVFVITYGIPGSRVGWAGRSERAGPRGGVRHASCTGALR
jgi:hypothetical protein